MAFKLPFSLSLSSRYEKAVKQYQPILDAVNALDKEYSALSDNELKEKVVRHKGKSLAELDPVLPEIFAGVREASKRTIKMRHFDVQILGGMALLKGNIAEMKTGEGKTLVATLPLVVQALTGRGAHLITVNDYLAQRDTKWMGPIYEFFGFNVGTILPGQSPEQKRAAYAADITYGTNNEFGFDYLRDNMAQHTDQYVQRDLNFALVDEVDNILIDEARTPLIISAPDEESTKLYQQFSQLVPRLRENDHYNIDEKRRAATLTDEGVTFVESELGIDNIYAEKGIRFVHHLEQALRAHTLYHRDKDYVVQNNQVIIVDEFTGRLMEGRRYSEGLHQALEAKERVPVQQESRTLATITFQNFFRLYDHLAGMTGTAVTSAEEFEKVYNLDVAVIPTNMPMIREDKPDKIFINEKAKFIALVEEIKRRHEKGQPALVGTIAIEKSEYLSALLKKEGIPHEVLNAKNHAREAEIIAQAGQRGAVTISTNMAGRGTDIRLGVGIADIGGLVVFGTERHEARRIDYQLRGRSGRQGDKGETQFYVSMEDDVMRIFGGGKIKNIMERLKLPETEPIENKMVTRAIEGAQERVEGYYFDMRKQVLAYDDVMNRQRNAIYTLRRSILKDGTWKDAGRDAMPIEDRIKEMIADGARQLVAIHAGDRDPSEWNIEEIAESIHSVTGSDLEDIHATLQQVVNTAKAEGPQEAVEHASNVVQDIMLKSFEERKSTMGDDIFSQLLRAASLRAIDMLWMDHLDTMDYLRTGIGLRGYGQRDPYVEYQKEGHRLFNDLLSTIQQEIVEVVFKAQAVRQDAYQGQAQHESTSAPHRIADQILKNAPPQESSTPQEGGARGGIQETAQTTGEPIRNPYKDVGRNDPCPCGAINPATKEVYKYKKCGLINAPYHKKYSEVPRSP